MFINPLAVLRVRTAILMPVLGMVVILFMMSAERWSRDLIANKHQKHFQQVPELALRRQAALDSRCQSRKQQDQYQPHEDLNQQVLRDGKTGFPFVQVSQRPEGLRNKNLAR